MMFHWICTVQVFRPDGQVKIGYQHGQCESLPGETRTDIFNKLFSQVTREVQRPGDSVAVPLFFSLEPMQLTASSQEAEYRVWGLQGNQPADR